jgi:FdhD protein
LKLPTERQPSSTYRISSFSPAGREERDDVVAVEEPLEIRLLWGPAESRQQQSISVTMRTPGDDEALALGFLFAEGIIPSGEVVVGVSHVGPLPPDRLVSNTVQVEIKPNIRIDVQKLLRNFYTSSSCGVCGKASIESLNRQAVYPVQEGGALIAPDVLGSLPQTLRDAQAVFATTGGLHAAGLFDETGQLLDVCEDIGRHNAMDKLIGRAMKAQALPLRARVIMLSGRASYELLQKAMMAGCPVVASVGAPSSLAVDVAEEFGISLIGFLRQDRFNVYANAQRIG